MNCETIRRLLDRGIEPGSSNEVRIALGFHLAECKACQAYRQQRQQQLLASLLDAPTEPMPEAPPPVAVPQTVAKRYRPFAIIAGLVLGIGILVVVWPLLSALLQIHANVQAYHLPTARVELAPVSAIVPTRLPTTAPTTPPTPAPAIVPPAGDPLEQATQPALTATAAPTPRIPPTPTITPVPLDGIVLQNRPNVSANGQTGNISAARTGNPNQPMTVLLLGVDRRPGESGPTRADSILIARIDPGRQRVALLSLPRDLIVPIPGYGQARINAANVYGELYPELGGGIELTRKTVANLLGMPIDYVVEVDFQGFIGAVDSIGGVDIDVPTELYDPEYPTMDYGYTVAHFLPGLQHMDGPTALMYARLRHADSDFMRMRRQQSVLVSMMQRVRSQNMFQQLQSIANLTTAMRGYIRTDLPEDEMVNLAWKFRSLSPDSVERYTLDENSIQVGVLADDPYAEFALPGAIERVTQQLLNGPSS